MAGVLRREKYSTTSAFSFEDLERNRRALLERARAEARQIIARAEEEGRRRAAALEKQGFPRGLEEGRKRGFEQAHQEGLETALRDARGELTQLSQAINAALAAFEQNKRRLLALAESGMLELVLAIARRVCKHDAGTSSTAARENARALLEMVKHDSDLELHFDPSDCDALREALPEVLAATDRLKHVEIVPDPNVGRGGCVLHAREGTIDARLETQLDRVATALVVGNDDAKAE